MNILRNKVEELGSQYLNRFDEIVNNTAISNVIYGDDQKNITKDMYSSYGYSCEIHTCFNQSLNNLGENHVVLSLIINYLTRKSILIRALVNDDINRPIYNTKMNDLLNNTILILNKLLENKNKGAKDDTK